jgi:mono/diheme cytochrome c family protein
MDSMSVGFRNAFAALLTLIASSAMAADGDTAQGQAVGAEAYGNTCAACHQPNGQGVPDTFPPLAGHAGEIAARPGGRDYLARLVFFGMEGPITVSGHTISGTMPPWGDVLTDEQLAAALNFVLHSWGNDKALPADFKPYTPADIAAARDAKLTAAQVYALRQEILPQATAPAAVAASAPVTFTQEQADRGHAAYRRNCQDCHGINLNDGEFGGAPLNGLYFSRHWGNGSVAALYGFMRAKMPPDRPGKLNPQTYADLTAFLLAKNGYQPAQSELPPDTEAQEHMNLKR